MIKRGAKKKAEGDFHLKILQPSDKERVLAFLTRWDLQDLDNAQLPTNNMELQSFINFSLPSPS